MQTLAPRSNLSETVFVLPPSGRRSGRAHPDLHAGARAAVRRPPDARRRVRARRPAREDRDPDRDRLRESCRSSSSATGPRIVFGEMEQPIPTWTAEPNAAAIFAALGVDGSGLPVERYDLGPATSTSSSARRRRSPRSGPTWSRSSGRPATASTASRTSAGRAGRRGCSRPGTASARTRRPALLPGRWRSISRVTVGSRSASRSRSRRGRS